MKLSLKVMTAGKQEGKLLPISLAQFLIGRDPQCHLRPASAMISKRHCAIIQRDDKVFLRDFDSTNGSFHNDEKVVGEVELFANDRIKVGPLEFCIVIESEAPINRPTPVPATVNPQKAPVAKAAPAKKPETAPQKVAAAADKDDSSDEDVVAMLLSLGDDSSSGLIPDGTTIHEMRVSPDLLNPNANQDDTKDNLKPDSKAQTNAKVEGNTINAAKAILEKMMRRPR